MFLLIFIGIPVYVLSTIHTGTKNLIAYIIESTKKPQAQSVTIYDAYYGNINGKMNNSGLAIAVVKATEGNYFEIENSFHVMTPIQPHDMNKKLVIVTILVQNNSDLTHEVNDCMIPSVNVFKLIGKKEYYINHVALQQFTISGAMHPVPIVLNTGDTIRMLLPFDVDYDENMYNMTLTYDSGIDFSNANIELPIQ